MASAWPRSMKALAAHPGFSPLSGLPMLAPLLLLPRQRLPRALLLLPPPPLTLLPALRHCCRRQRLLRACSASTLAALPPVHWEEGQQHMCFAGVLLVNNSWTGGGGGGRRQTLAPAQADRCPGIKLTCAPRNCDESPRSTFLRATCMFWLNPTPEQSSDYQILMQPRYGLVEQRQEVRPAKERGSKVARYEKQVQAAIAMFI